ncbi:MAG: FHA domain-containing protein [Deltaproteobacteria bacterium]|nr:FHA domain-containing protein [Deltaproteobacteria bacterium]
MGGGVEVDDSLLGEDGIQATSMELPNLAAMGLMPGKAKAGAAAEEIVDSGPPAEDDAGHVRTLILSADGRELDRVTKERFLIGRGKHCDLIINSGKVSREHAVITREGNDFFIEDLGSSNGTWFDKRRIGKRQIQDGDEYYVCAEKLTCQLR